MGGGARQVQSRVVGRYVLFEEVAHGGMATVYLGRLRGPGGFARTVAIKQLHAQYARDPAFVGMFLDEAKLAARIKHPNVVSVLDVVRHEHDLLLVMDYVSGESLANLLAAARKKSLPPSPELVAHCLCDVLAGLHAAHETANDAGQPLDIVHRDVSPQNILVGTDGVARVLDFGIARASERSVGTATGEGMIRGKVSYMSPEQLSFEAVDRRSDIYSASVVLWESLVGAPLYGQRGMASMVALILLGELEPPSKHVPGIPPELDAVVMRGLARDPADRFATAEEMALALEKAVAHVPSRNVAQWVAAVADETLRTRADIVSRTERQPLPTITDWPPPPEPPPEPGAAAPSQSGASPRFAPVDPDVAVTRSPPAAEAGRPPRRFPTLVVAVTAVSLLVGLTGIGSYVVGRSRDAPAPGPAAPSGLASEPAGVASAAAAMAPPPPASSASVVEGPAQDPLAVAPGASARRSKGMPSERGSAARAPALVPVAVRPTPGALAAAAPTPAPPPSPSTPVEPPPPPAAAQPEPAPARTPVPSTFDMARASATTVVTKVSGVTSGAVRSALPSARFTACYRDALKVTNRRLEGTMTVHIETDIDGRVTSTRVAAPDALASSTAPCIKRSLNQLEIRNADTGGASANFDINFKPE